MVLGFDDGGPDELEAKCDKKNWLIIGECVGNVVLLSTHLDRMGFTTEILSLDEAFDWNEEKLPDVVQLGRLDEDWHQVWLELRRDNHDAQYIGLIPTGYHNSSALDAGLEVFEEDDAQALLDYARRLLKGK